jgi:DHA2 family multidrug resistance protein-like MFS transporter
VPPARHRCQVGGSVAAKAGPTIVVRTGIVVQTVGVLVAAATLDASTTWLALALPLALFGMGSGLASSQLTNVILSGVPRDHAGSASGVSTTNNSIGAGLGIAVLGAVLRAGSLRDVASSRWALVTAAALLALGVVASAALPSVRPQAVEAERAAAPRGAHSSSVSVPIRESSA